MPLEPGFSDAELRQIVCGATNLTERLGSGWISTGEDRSTAAKRLERWKRLSAHGDDTAFRRILASQRVPAITEKRLLGLLGSVRSSPDLNIPPWAILLREIVSALADDFRAGLDPVPLGPPQVTRRIPFADLYTPIAKAARRKVEALIPSHAKHLNPEAWHGLQRHLLGRVSTICSLALQPKFLAFKAARQPGPAFAFFEQAPPTRGAPPAATPYRGFVREQGADGLRSFFLEYPVAARLTAQVTQAWIEFVAEFLRRLKADAAAIATRFGTNEATGKIAAIKAGLSDSHRGGRSVLLLRFSGGGRLLYKPRPLQVDAAFYDLLAAFNARLRHGPTPCPVTLVRVDYGWQSFVAHSSCPNRREARRFYRRAGALLALLHRMRGIDFHCENLIAAGGHPVPVDLEGLWHPPIPEPAFPTGLGDHQPRLDSSILRTGLLPVRDHDLQKNYLPDYSALGAPLLQNSAVAGVRWRYVNTTRMEAFWGTSRYQCATHLPRLSGRSMSAREHLAELVAGYRRAARLLCSDDQAAGELRARLTDTRRWPTRLIHRPTHVYLALIRSSLQPHLLTSGVDRSIALQSLPETPAENVIRAEEIAALEILDVPYFNRASADPVAVLTEVAASESAFDSAVDAIRVSLRKPPVRRRAKSS